MFPREMGCGLVTLNYLNPRNESERFTFPLVYGKQIQIFLFHNVITMPEVFLLLRYLTAQAVYVDRRDLHLETR